MSPEGWSWLAAIATGVVSGLIWCWWQIRQGKW